MENFAVFVKRGAVVPVKEHVFLIDLNRCLEMKDIHFEDFISCEEKERLRRILLPQSRIKVLHRISMTRMVLSHYLDYPAHKIKFSRNAFGKPSIKVPVTDLKFNISHSGNYLILIADRTRQTGIDIETEVSFQKRDYEMFTEIYSEEEIWTYRLLTAKEKYDMFCRTWVMKEAIVKALGQGLTADLKTITIPFQKDSEIIKLLLKSYEGSMEIQWIKKPDCQIGIAYWEEGI